jgi:bifunctional non-homologous end joining protein LigD
VDSASPFSVRSRFRDDRLMSSRFRCRLGQTFTGRLSKSCFTVRLWAWELDSCGVGPTFSAMSVTRELRRRLQSDRSSPRFEPCLPRPVQHPPAGPGWIHEIKHDGFRILAHRGGRSVRLLTRNGNDLGDRFPLAAAAIEELPVKSCVIDGEAIVCDDSGFAVFDLIRGHGTNARAVLCAFDLLEVNGEDIRAEPIEDRKRRLAGLLRLPHDGIALNEQFKGDGAMIYKHACALGCEGIVSKRLGSPYRAGRSAHWLKIKNPDAPAVRRLEEDWA